MVQKNSFTIFNHIKKILRLSCVQSRDALMNVGTESLNKVQLELVREKCGDGKKHLILQNKPHYNTVQLENVLKHAAKTIQLFPSLFSNGQVSHVISTRQSGFSVSENRKTHKQETTEGSCSKCFISSWEEMKHLVMCISPRLQADTECNFQELKRVFIFKILLFCLRDGCKM